ncbi:MAG: hydrogenase expression/formation protein HypE [Bacilli bacterium]
MNELRLARRRQLTVADLPDVVQIAQGSGGKLTHQLIETLFVPLFDNPYLKALGDQAILGPSTERMALSTDAFVVKPYVFPGGNIGDLAVNGTVNDLLMGGATPAYLTASFILEEGLPTKELVVIVEAMATAAKRAGVQIVAGDTKVVERGAADGLYITTAGVGFVPQGIQWSPTHIRAGDVVIVSGTVGDHGASVLAHRFGIDFESQIESDTACLRDVVLAVRDLPGIRCMRDPTRGGLATTVQELSQASGLNLRIRETAIAIQEDVRGICEVLGLDALYLACEGRLVAVVAPEETDECLRIMRTVQESKDAAVIGEVTDDIPGFASLETYIGAVRVLDLLSLEQLPRIC